MSNIYKNKKLTNYFLRHNEWIRLGKYSLYKESDKFILKDEEGKVLSKYNDLLSGVVALINAKKGGENGK